MRERCTCDKASHNRLDVTQRMQAARVWWDTSSSALILFKSASPVPSVSASLAAPEASAARICIIWAGGGVVHRE